MQKFKAQYSQIRQGGLFKPILFILTSTSAELSFYIHAVSPVKKADKNEKHYFNMILQTKDESIKAVCFSPEKQSELKTLEKVESPVKIQNFQKPDKDILLNKFTKIKPIEKSEIDFILVNMFYKSLLCNRQVNE